MEVKTHTGEWFKMRILPYRTIDNRIDGLVLTFSSIDIQKKAQEHIQIAMELTRSVFDMNSDPIAVLDKNGEVVIANSALSNISDVPQKNITGMKISSLLGIQAGDYKLDSKLDTALKNAEGFSIEDITISSKKEHFTVEARIINTKPDFPYRILFRFIGKNK